MAALIDTNVLVYRYDFRYPEKQETATALLRQGIADRSIRLPHQAVVEFVSAISRPTASGEPLLPREDALLEAEEILAELDILDLTELLLRRLSAVPLCTA